MAALDQVAEPESEGTVVRHLKSWDTVAFLGLLTFASTFGFEAGRAAYWGYPIAMVRVTPENALLTFVQLAMGGMMAAWVVSIAKNSKLFRGIVGTLCLLVLVVGAIRLRNVWGGLGLMFAFFAVIYCAIALYAVFRKDGESDPFSGWIIPRLGRTGTVLSTALVVVSFAAVALSYFLASNQSHFVVTVSEPRRIVLASFGSDAVCAMLHVDKDRPWISQTFTLIDFKDEKLGTVRTEEIKFLQVREK